jgi:hypothetical protein
MIHHGLSFHRGRGPSGELPMGYINRVLDRYSRSPRRQHHGHHSGPPPAPVASPQTSPAWHKQSDKTRHYKRKHHHHKMTSFNGPWSDDLNALKKAVQSMPEQYKSSFSSASKDVLEKVCDPDVLHVWETDSDIDNLLQLTSVIAKLCNLGTRKEKGANASDGSMVIIAEEKSGRNNFARICQLVEYLTCASGKKHLDGTVAAFGTIMVVRGWNNSIRSDNSNREVSSTIKRINIAIERVFKTGNFPSGKKKIVWHQGPVIHFLLTWINNTTSLHRSALYAITVTGSLDLSDSVKPSSAGRSNTLPDLTCLETYAKKLDLPVLFLDPASQLLNYSHLATYMYYYAYYINTFLPSSLSRPHLYKAQDGLVTFAFQILGASKNKYGESVVRLVKDHLDSGKAKKWARGCVDSRNYEKNKCRRAGKEGEIHKAVQIADGPFATLSPTNDGLPAFARLAVGPAAAGSMEYHIAAPTQISFSESRFRPSSPAVFHILIPAPPQDLEKVTNRVQGLMMAVLERVRQEKGNPELAEEEREMWASVRGGVDWALKEAKGKMPESIEAKVKFVREKLTKGTWGAVMGGAKDGGDGGKEGVSDAAKANMEAVRAYGAGRNSFGQPSMGYGGQSGQQMGFAQPQQQMAFGQPQQPVFGGQQGMTAPPNSPGQPYAPLQYAQGQAYTAPSGYGAQNHGYGQPRIINGGYAQSQGMGVGGASYGGPPPPLPMRQSSRGGGCGGGYLQSMGGPRM